MTYPIRELEGTWEEVSSHGPEFAGKRVRLLVLTDGAAEQNGTEVLNRAPVQDLSAFLAALPDLGKDADVLWESIAENRRMRRTLAEEKG